ncbi:pullulanase-type alpha-1,6-glucosidase [Sesbania bispinosa]|nr:pullulanase-type alpha-1,6-glucosidase [Sesbania bispinosa]
MAKLVLCKSICRLICFSENILESYRPIFPYECLNFMNNGEQRVSVLTSEEDKSESRGGIHINQEVFKFP